MSAFKVVAAIGSAVLLAGGYTVKHTRADVVEKFCPILARFASKPPHRHESFRGGDSATFLRTNVTTYWLGDACSVGKVIAINGHTAVVQTDNGVPISIVADDDPTPVAPTTMASASLEGTPAPVAYAAPGNYPAQRRFPAQGQVPVSSGNAEWHPRPTPEIDADERRMERELHAPTGVIKNREMLPAATFTTHGSRSGSVPAGKVQTSSHISTL